MTRAAFAVVVILSLLGVSRSHALTLCTKRKGQVSAREACQKKEKPVDLSTLGPLGPRGMAGEPGGPGAAGVFPLRILDSAGKDLGTILRFRPQNTLVESTDPILGQPVMLVAKPDGFPHDTNKTIYYQATDCSGVPFMRGLPGFVLAQVVGDFAYYSSAQGLDQGYASYEMDDTGQPCSSGGTATGHGSCCFNAGGQGNSLQPAVRVSLTALGIPPFRAVPR